MKYQYEKLTITAQSYNKKITVEIPCDSDVNEFIDACKCLAIGLTYQETSWDDSIVEIAENLNLERSREI